MLQALPLDIKIAKTKQRIREWVTQFGVDGVYVSFSGGKDSTVLLDLVRQDYLQVEAVFVDTGLEYPEIREFVKRFENVKWLKPKMRFDEVIKKYGYPVVSKEISAVIQVVINKPNGRTADKFKRGSGYHLKYGDKFLLERYKYLLDAPFEISDKCCHIMKKAPIREYERKTSKHPIIGIMADESSLRELIWLQQGCNSFDAKRPQSKPLSFWTEQDILHYIKDNNLPYATIYGDIVPANQLDGQLAIDGCEGKLTTTGAKRTGCMFCAFGITQDGTPNRFQRMAITHPKMHDYCIRSAENNGLGMGEVLDYIGVKYKP